MKRIVSILAAFSLASAVPAQGQDVGLAITRAAERPSRVMGDVARELFAGAGR